MELLLEMLKSRRPHQSETEEAFIDRYLSAKKANGHAQAALTQDTFGNVIGIAGSAEPRIMWASHIDTVHSQAGIQQVDIHKFTDGNHYAMLSPLERRSDCLGADDTAGVWLMLEMFRNDVPGMYIWHRGEERGCLGSRFIANCTPDLLKHIDICVSLDRFGVDSVITHQLGMSCSDGFAFALAAKLGGRYKPDDTGIFTDSAQYVDLVSECTNLSVGYYGHHTEKEVLNLDHLLSLRDRMLKADFSDLPILREPGEEDWFSWKQQSIDGDYDFKPPSNGLYDDTVLDTIRDNSYLIADLLYQYGLSDDEIVEFVYENGGTVHFDKGTMSNPDRRLVG